MEQLYLRFSMEAVPKVVLSPFDSLANYGVWICEQSPNPPEISPIMDTSPCGSGEIFFWKKEV